MSCTLIDGNKGAQEGHVYELTKEVCTQWFSTGRYCRIGTIGDGSCFFHSILLGLNASIVDGKVDKKKPYQDGTHEEKRRMAAAFRQGLSEKFRESDFLEIQSTLVARSTKSYEDIKRELLNTKTWAEEVMIKFTSKVLNCNVVFLDLGDNVNRMYCGVANKSTVEKIKHCDEPTVATIIIAWVNRSHFELVGRIDEETSDGNYAVRTCFSPHNVKDKETITNVMTAYNASCDRT